MTEVDRSAPLPITLDPEAARTIRSEIDRAGGREVCFLADVDPERRIVHPRTVARGNHQAVVAAARDAREGQILVHNHPSGTLDPSPADLTLAARAFESGLGTAIVDNAAGAVYVVVEPPAPRVRIPLDIESSDRILAPGGPLSARFPGYEDRPAQRAMLEEVVRRYNEGGVAVVEAGTGTGKSLAYLLPAALWAQKNGHRTVVSTHTINLQEQLVGKDLPLLQGLLDDPLRWALVKGRGNYVSIRRLLLAHESAPALFAEDRSSELGELVEWSRTTQDGSLSDLSSTPSEAVWDEVRSDGDICMGSRCPHFQACFYQRARRAAASAQVLVVNHALLFADLSVRRATDNWMGPAVLPPYGHLVLDEGHNVEDAATSHLGTEVTRTGVLRTLDRLDRRGRGVLGAAEGALATAAGQGEAARLLERVRTRIRPRVKAVRDAVVQLFDAIEPVVPKEGEESLRLGKGDPRDPGGDPEVEARLERATAEAARLGRELRELRTTLEDDPELGEAMEGRVLDLRSLERRIESWRLGLELVLGPPSDGVSLVRWVERGGGRGRNIRLAAAPVEPGNLLRTFLFPRMDTVLVTSATLAVGQGSFDFIRHRLGLDAEVEPTEVQTADRSTATPAGPRAPTPVGAAQFSDVHVTGEPHDAGHSLPFTVTETLLASPFDYRSQTLFCVPTDLPPQDAGQDFQEATADVVKEFAEVTDGGLFVLFTSHRALRSVAARLRQRDMDAHRPVLVQGEAPRTRLLNDFVRSERAVLLGTSAFWEGVDVPGRPLRGVVVQKIPFRVPTEPITQARMEALELRGRGGFQSYLVPLAALRLKQGFGRLVRSRQDRGGVLLLDARIVRRGYGRILRKSLPDAPLVRGPWRDVRQQLERFYRATG